MSWYQYGEFEREAMMLVKQLAKELGTVRISATAIEDDERFRKIAAGLRMRKMTTYDLVRICNLYPARPNKDDLVRSLQVFNKEYGITPTQLDADARIEPLYSTSAYVRQFGSWNAALIAAKLKTNHEERRDIDAAKLRQELIDYLRKLYGKDGVLPTTIAHDASNPEHKSWECRKYIGPWPVVAEATELRLAPGCQRRKLKIAA